MTICKKSQVQIVNKLSIMLPKPSGSTSLASERPLCTLRILHVCYAAHFSYKIKIASFYMQEYPVRIRKHFCHLATGQEIWRKCCSILAMRRARTTYNAFQQKYERTCTSGYGAPKGKVMRNFYFIFRNQFFNTYIDFIIRI